VKKVTLADILHEYLGQPKTLREASERMQKKLTPKEQEALRAVFDRQINNPKP